MASTLVKIDVHLIFHVKSTGVSMRKEDLGRIFSYIGGLIKGLDGIPIEIGGVTESCTHFHFTAKREIFSGFCKGNQS